MMFSVVIPLYNKEKYIRRAVDSVLEQEFKDFELIIVNDGSTDDSLSKIKDIDDERVRIIDQSNQGEGAARNKGIIEAKGDWIAFLDADDAWMRDHLSELYRIVEFNSSSGLISTQIMSIYEGESLNVPNSVTENTIRKIDYFLETAKNILTVTSSSSAINKNIYKKLGGFTSDKMGADLEYWARIALDYPVCISSKVTACYYKGVGGVTEQQSQYEYKEINSLYEVSPSIKLIVERAKQDPSILKQSNIISYINSRLLGGVKIWLYHENIVAAKNLSKLALPQKDAKYLTLYFVTRAPIKLLKTVIKSYKILK